MTAWQGQVFSCTWNVSLLTAAKYLDTDKTAGNL